MGSFPAASFQKSSPTSPRSRWRSSRARSAAFAPMRSASLEVVFLSSPSLHDGRFANDGWLQELPDPITKLTWDNPALVSPKTAESLGLASEDGIGLEYAGRSLELPVWILPGMADGVVALTLGYGRSHAGRIGSGVGFDVYPVRSSKAPGFGSGARVTKLARTYPLSATQNHGSMEGRPLVRESTLTELRSEAASPPAEGGSAHAGLPRRSAEPGQRAEAGLPRRSAEPGQRAEAGDAEHAPKGGRVPARSASSNWNRITSRSGRSTLTIRGRSGG